MIDRTKAPEVRRMGRITLPKPSTELLANGITLHVINGGEQEVIQLAMIWQGGIDECREPAIAEILCNLMTEGTDKMDGGRLSEYIDFHGAILKIARDQHYMMLNLVCLNKMAAPMLEVVRDVICSPSLPEDAFLVYRDKAVKDFLLSQSNVLTVGRQALAPLIMGSDNPLARLTTPEIIESVRLDELKAFHDKVFTASGCHAFLCGKVTEGILAKVIAMLESLPAPVPETPIVLHPFLPEAPQTVKVEVAGASQCAVCAALPAPQRDNPDYIPLRFATTALGGYFGSRLMKNIREDKGLTYGISSYLLGARDGCYVQITAQTDAAYATQVIDELRVELKQMAENPPRGEELERLRQVISLQLMENLESPFTIADYYRVIQMLDLPDGYFDSQVELLQSLSHEIIADVAAKYLKADALRIVVAG